MHAYAKWHPAQNTEGVEDKPVRSAGSDDDDDDEEDDDDDENENLDAADAVADADERIKAQ